MKKALYLIFALVLAAAAAYAQAPTDDIAKAGACPLCGMNRQTFNYSRVYVQYLDGSVEGTCSVHCAAALMAVGLDKIPTAIWVGDYDTKQLIDAEQAVWVVGGSKSGVMTARAKWAFGTRAAADAFIKANGGSVATFDLVLKAAYEDMYADTMMIRDRRAAKRKAAADAAGMQMQMPVDQKK